MSYLTIKHLVDNRWQKDSKEEKKADAKILKVLSDIAAEETNKEDPLTARANGPEDPAPATSEGSRAVEPTPAPTTSEGFLSPAPTPATLVEIEALVQSFSPGSTLEPGLKAFRRRGSKWLL
jgi:hypothetical protein